MYKWYFTAKFERSLMLCNPVDNDVKFIVVRAPDMVEAVAKVHKLLLDFDGVYVKGSLSLLKIEEVYGEGL